MSPGVPEVPENQIRVRLTRMIRARNGVMYPRWSIVWCEMVLTEERGNPYAVAERPLALRIIASNHEGPVLLDDDWTVIVPDCIESG